MINYYPTYYVVPVIPIIFSDESRLDNCYNNEYNSRYIPTISTINYPYRNIDEDIFHDADEAYINEIIKKNK